MYVYIYTVGFELFEADFRLKTTVECVVFLFALHLGYREWKSALVYGPHAVGVSVGLENWTR